VTVRIQPAVVKPVIEHGLAIWLHGRVRPLATYGEEMVRDFRRAAAIVIKIELTQRQRGRRLDPQSNC
jgi:hypothetical protein